MQYTYTTYVTTVFTCTCTYTCPCSALQLGAPIHAWCHSGISMHDVIVVFHHQSRSYPYPEVKVDESAVIDSTVPSGSTSMVELEWDSALEWVSGVNGMRSCKTPPTGYAHMLLCWSLAPLHWVNLKSWGRERPCLPSPIQRSTWNEELIIRSNHGQ